MDSFDLRQPPTPSSRGALIWNVLTIVVLIAALCLVGAFMSIFDNPFSSLNPFPPPTPPTPYLSPTPTWTPRTLPPTWTPTATLSPSETPTPRPSFTPIPTNTGFVVPLPTSRYTPTKTRTPTRSPVPTGLPFAMINMQTASSELFRPDVGCNWLGVAGQILDKNDSPLLYQYIRLGGTLNGQVIDYLGMSGTAPNYGLGAYEFTLADHPIASNNTLWIQIVDQSLSVPLSEKIYFKTYETCDKNLVLIRFKRVR